MDEPARDEVTFVFTDLVDSTVKWERDAAEMAAQLEVHDRLIGEVAAEHGGEIFSAMGDGFAIAFTEPHSAVAAAIAMQRAIHGHDWPPNWDMAIRVGAHIGRPVRRDGDFFGPPVNRAARVQAAGHAGQIVITQDLLDALDATRFGTTVRFVALGEHRLKGVSRPLALVGVLAEGLPQRFEPIRTLDAARFSVPVPPSSIVGRDAEIDTVLELLDHRRCVTVTATGGAGKTRLAIEVAALAADRFAGGVHMFELAGADHLDNLVSRVAEAALGPEPTAGPAEHLRRLVVELREPVLVVLDNAEHVIDECADRAVELLRATPHLTLLVTSRTPLRIDGEQVFPLDPLGTVPQGVERGPAGPSPAAELFVARALAVDPRADLTDLDLIERLVERLDGLPLAVELAAARITVLTPAEILEHLDDLAKGGSRRRGGSHRQATVASAIEWSYGQCDPIEQQLLCRLSVFSGSFDLAAVLEVCVDDHLDTVTVIDAITELVDQSLVATEDTDSGRRFHLLRLIRAFAAERWTGFDDTETFVGRHGRYYAGLARKLARSLHEKSDPAMIAVISAEHDNFVAALERGVAVERYRTDARWLALSLQPYWEDTGRLRAGADWLTALATPHDIGDRAWAGVCLVGTTYDAMCGLTPEGRTPLALIRQFAEMGVPGAHAAQMALAFVDLSTGRMEEAIERFERAAASFEGNQPNVRQALVTAASCSSYLGDTQAAIGFLARAAAVGDEGIQAWFPPYCEVFERGVRLAGGIGSDADIGRLVRSLEALVATGLETRITIAGHHAVWALAEAGHHDLARQWLPRVIVYPRRTGYLWFTLTLADLAAHLGLLDGRVEDAVRLEGAVDRHKERAGFGFARLMNERRARGDRSALDGEALSTLSAEGAGMSVKELADLAIAIVS